MIEEPKSLIQYAFAVLSWQHMREHALRSARRRFVFCSFQAVVSVDARITFSTDTLARFLNDIADEVQRRKFE